MNISELLERLEIEEDGHIEYFEQLAELIETPEDIEYDVFVQALAGLDPETAGELTENYFEELVDAVPDEEDDLVSLMDSVQQNLLMLAENIDKEDIMKRFSQQLFKFREWLIDPLGAAIDGADASVLEAIFRAREDRLTGEEHDLDFADSLDYDLDDAEYSIGTFTEIDVVGED